MPVHIQLPHFPQKTIKYLNTALQMANLWKKTQVEEFTLLDCSNKYLAMIPKLVGGNKNT